MLSSQKTRIKIQSRSDAEALLDYYRRNQSHLAPWEPLRDSSFHTLEHFQLMGEDSERFFEEGANFRFVVQPYHEDRIIGVCNYSNVVYGVFQACFLGYSIDHAFQAKGYMTEVLTTTIDYMFSDVGLHRIMANYMPRNLASAKLLQKLGFEQEGYARDYLRIAGRWEDHVLTAKVNNGL